MKCFNCNRRIKREQLVNSHYIMRKDGILLYGIYTHFGVCSKRTRDVITAAINAKQPIRGIRDIRRAK